MFGINSNWLATQKRLGTRLVCAVTIVPFLLTSGCATRGAGYVPLVDMKGRSHVEFDSDLRECQAYAKERMGAGEGAVAGAVGGALFGALLGSLLAPRGYRNEVSKSAAKVGAFGGAAGGADRANNTQESITKQCLAGRGYNVLN